VTLDAKKNTMHVVEDLTYFNQSNDTLHQLVLNDWNNAYSDKNSWLGKRFSDEFVRSFHLAKEKDRGNTSNLTISDANNLDVPWSRPENNIDLIEVVLSQAILPNEKRSFHLDYTVKIPNDRFTGFGFNDKGGLNLRTWFLTPARYEDYNFVHYSNANLDDIANGISDFDLEMTLPNTYRLNSDLNETGKVKNQESTTYTLSGKNRTDFSLFAEPKSEFYSYKNGKVEVLTNLEDNKLGDIQKAIIIDRVVDYVSETIGEYSYQKITVSQADYERNPFYGLNQLPSYISFFSDEFLYEIKFLKTYVNNYLKNTLHLDPRKDNWIYDGIQVYTMMNYIDEYHPDAKMMGSLAKFKLLKAFNIINVDFNEQYSYYYMLMARKNLDQPLSNSKETLIRFNEKIASKYRAGLSLKYLDNYLEAGVVPKTIQEFYAMNTNKMVDAKSFESLFKKNTTKDIEWFFSTIIESRDIIDYKFGDVSKTKDSITFTIKNKTGTTVPIPVYGIKDKNIVFKKWFENVRNDSTFTIERLNADKIVLNYKNEVPEYNLRNNWKSLKGFFFNNRPFKFIFLKDLEDPYYNQITYVPTLTYNYYDGMSPGFRFHNKTVLSKPFNYDINPIYSIQSKSIKGNLSFVINDFHRDSRFYYTRYALQSAYFHYAPDASYFKINPNITFYIRENDFRDNRKQGIIFKYNVVQKQRSAIVVDSGIQNYSVFSFKYFNTKTEVTNHVNFLTDTQFSTSFGKVSGEMQYRKLFNNNRQINARLYAGTFLYNKNGDTPTFNFGLSSVNDYLFEYELLGRSETTGIFSQQFILAEGGFKSKVLPASVNEWLVTANGSFNVWNWVEIYGDLGCVKNKNVAEKWVYDSGVRLNLVTDYFELYFPVYSNNGWEIAQTQYSEKIRIVLTLDPKILINLFTRKWF
jgi:hypothetical protein